MNLKNVFIQIILKKIQNTPIKLIRDKDYSDILKQLISLKKF